MNAFLNSCGHIQGFRSTERLLARLASALPIATELQCCLSYRKKFSQQTIWPLPNSASLDTHTRHSTRRAGLQGLQGVIKKVGRQEGLQLNIWDWDHMNKIVPAFLFILQERATQRER